MPAEVRFDPGRVAAAGGPRDLPAASHAVTELVLLRHAPTDWNDRRRRQGWSDQPLTRAGRALVRAWARRTEIPVAALFSSDLRRAAESARIIAGEWGHDDPTQLFALREQDQGQWTGLTREQIKARWPERFRERPRRPVEGESGEVLLSRVFAAVGTIAAAHPGSRVLAVTHSGVIRGLESHLGADAPPVPYLAGRHLHVAARDGSFAIEVGQATAHRNDNDWGQRHRGAGEEAA